MINQIITNYNSAIQKAQELIATSNEGKLENNLHQANIVINDWRNYVRALIDSHSLAGFESIQQNAVAPMWNSYNDLSIKIFTDIELMKKQMNWLINRDKQGTTVFNISDSQFNYSNISNSNNVSVNQTNDNKEFPSNDELKKLVEIFENNFSDLNLEEDNAILAKSQINTIKAQVISKPNHNIIKEAGRTLRSITEGVIGGLIANSVNPEIWSFAINILKTLTGN